MTESPKPRSALGARGAIARILSGSIIGQGLLIVISPFLTRIYSPEDFGALAVVTSVSAILGSFVTLCWEMAIVLPRDSERARAVAFLGLGSTAALSIVLTAVAYLWRHDFSGLLGAKALIDFWWIIPVTSFVIGVFKVATSWFVRQQEYTKIAWRNFTQGLGQAIGNIAFGLLGWIPFGLISGVGLGRGVAILGLLGKDSFLAGPRVPLSVIRSSAKRYRRFPLITTWSRTLNSIGLQLPIVLLSSIYGSFTIGFLALTMRVLASPVSIISDAVSQYYEGAFGVRLRNGSTSLTRLTGVITSRLALIGAVPTIIVLIWAPALFAFVFGSQWAVAGSYAQIMILAYFAQFVVAPISRTITLLERQHAQMIWDISRAALTCGVIVAAGALSLPMVWAVAAFAIVQVLAYTALLLMSLSFTKRAALQSR